MYQCYVVQRFGGVPYNVILGREYATEEDAEEIADVYIRNFGRVDRVVIEPSGTEIPRRKPKKRTIKDVLNDILEALA